MSLSTKHAKRLKRRRRVRSKVRGTAERPRLSVFRSNHGMQAQVIDDVKGHTLAAVVWTEDDLKSLPRMEQAKKAGELVAARAKEAGVEQHRLRPWRLPLPRPGPRAGRRGPRRRARASSYPRGTSLNGTRRRK